MRLLWKNLLDFGTVTATDENSNYPAENLTYKRQRSRTLLAPYKATEDTSTISLALDAPQTVDALGIGNHNVTDLSVTLMDADTEALFHFDDSLNSTAGLEPEAGYVATLRDDGWQGGAVAVEEGTTNLWTTHTYNPLPTGWGNKFASATGTTYTMSCKAKSVTGATLRIAKTGGGGDSDVDESTVLTTVNQDIAVTFDSTAAQDLYLYDFAAVGDIVLEDVQLEAKAFATSFVDGTRAAGKLEYAYTLTKQGTFSCRIKLNQDVADMTDYTFIFDHRTPRTVVYIDCSLLKFYIKIQYYLFICFLAFAITSLTDR
jgi:hypothetical protein